MNPVRKKNESSIDILEYNPDELKQKHVIDVYNQISKKFDKTRFCKWPAVDEFMRDVSENVMLLEVGVGNGRNLVDSSSCNFGIDICDDFLQMSSKNGYMIKADQINLPFKDNTFDVVLSVAVFHHLPTEEERRQCAKEMKRVLMDGGRLFLEVFERCGEQSGDVFLKWRNPDGEVYDRYYHRFEEEELKEYFGRDVEVKRECNNIIIILQK